MKDESYFHESRSKYIDPLTRGIYCVGNKKECDFLEEDGATRISWGTSPNASDFGKIRYLYLLPTPTQIGKGILPEFVSSISDVELLCIPFPFIPGLTAGALPRHLQCLMMSIQGGYAEKMKGREVRWPGLVLPELKGMFFSGHFEPPMTWTNLSISSDQLPTLEFVHTNVDKKRDVLYEVEKFNTLEHLELNVVGNLDVFNHIKSPLRVLAINNSGNLFPISNITKLRMLETLSLKFVKSEIDCALFTQLTELIEIEMVSSKKIKNIHSLLDCRNLKSIRITNCGNPFKAEGKATFKKKGYERLNIDFS